MENLITSVLKADKKEAIKLANKLKAHKVFQVKIENDLITIKSPLKNFHCRRRERISTRRTNEY